MLERGRISSSLHGGGFLCRRPEFGRGERRVFYAQAGEERTGHGFERRVEGGQTVPLPPRVGRDKLFHDESAEWGRSVRQGEV